MTDVYRTSALICPACASPMREFQKRLVCDACEGMLIEIEDFRSACADIVGPDTQVELFDHHRASSGEERKPVCPRCSGELAVCRVRVAGKKMRGKFSVCDRDGLWFGRDVLAGVFAILGRKFTHPTSFDAAGAHTRRQYQARTPGDASRHLTIARWRDRPRARAQTLTPINAYRDQKLLCPVCAASDLFFMGDRWGCHGCRGLFVETAAIEVLVADMIDEPWTIPVLAGVPGERRCPVCVMAMTVEKLEDVTIDRCPTHGVWFDPVELEAVLVHANEAANPRGLLGWLRRLF